MCILGFVALKKMRNYQRAKQDANTRIVHTNGRPRSPRSKLPGGRGGPGMTEYAGGQNGGVVGVGDGGYGDYTQRG